MLRGLMNKREAERAMERIEGAMEEKEG